MVQRVKRFPPSLLGCHLQSLTACHRTPGVLKVSIILPTTPGFALSLVIETARENISSCQLFKCGFLLMFWFLTSKSGEGPYAPTTKAGMKDQYIAIARLVEDESH